MARGFVRSHGSEYAQRITSLNSHFLAELIRLGIEQHVEDLDSTTDSIGPTGARCLRSRSMLPAARAHAMRLHTLAVRAYESHIEQIATGKRTPAQVQQAASAYLERNLPVHLARLVHLYFDLLNSVTELSTAVKAISPPSSGHVRQTRSGGTARDRSRWQKSAASLPHRSR